MTGTVLTKYEVLEPTKTPGLFKSLGYVYFETAQYQTKTPEFVKDMLIQSGGYTPGIRLIRM